MAEASARIRLSDTATIDDVQRAMGLTKTWRNELMGENYDETALHTGKKAGLGTKERTLLDIINTLQNQSTENMQVANLIDIFNEAQRFDIHPQVEI